MKDIQYVQILHEGTRRMFSEMEKAGLPPPEFSPPRKTHVIVTLYNDIDRRKAAQSSSQTNPTTSNAFRLEYYRTKPFDPLLENHEAPPSYSELRTKIESAISGVGFSVSSFTKDIAVDFNEPPLLKIRDLASIHSALCFRLRQYGRKMYLVLDYKAETRNRATLMRIKAVAPSLLRQRLRRGFAKIDGSWHSCIILALISKDNKAIVDIGGTGSRKEVECNFDNVLPDLGNSQIGELLKIAKVEIDFYKEQKRLSQINPRLRLEKINGIANNLRRLVFPLTIRDYQIQLSSEPANLLPPDFFPSISIREPAIAFSNDRPSKEVAKGLTAFGTFEKPNVDIPLVLISPTTKMAEMENLVARLQNGSMSYKGFTPTFGARLQIRAKHIIDTPDRYLDACKQVALENTAPTMPIALIYMPDRLGLWSKGNYESPYYRVKHFLLEHGIPSQGVDQNTLANPKWKDLNLALDIFAKAGYTPWVLSEGLPLADVFVGLAYSSIRTEQQLKRLIAYVCVFDRFGRWQYYVGNVEPIPFEERDTRLAELIRDAIQQHPEHSRLQHVHVHYGNKFKFDTRIKLLNGIQQIVPTANISFLYINEGTPVRLFSTSPSSQNLVERGTCIQVGDDKKFFLATTGQNELNTKTSGTPKIIEASINHYGSADTKDLSIYAQHILSLTKLNWASTRSYSSEPITLLYARKIARFMNIFMNVQGSFHLHPSLEKTPWFL